jgi:hypothetical protein
MATLIAALWQNRISLIILSLCERLRHPSNPKWAFAGAPARGRLGVLHTFAVSPDDSSIRA